MLETCFGVVYSVVSWIKLLFLNRHLFMSFPLHQKNMFSVSSVPILHTQLAVLYNVI